MSEPVAVVTVTYSPGDSLKVFLDTLMLATREPLDIVLADNGSTDGSVEAEAARPGVRIVETGGNLGYGRAANIGARETTAEFLVVANPDIVWEPGSLDALLAAARRWPTGASFGPLIRTPDGEIYPSARALPSSVAASATPCSVGGGRPTRGRPPTGSRATPRPSAPRAGCRARACCCAATPSTRSEGSTPTYFMYFEDLDLGERLSAAGWQNVYVPSAVVAHIGGHATSREFSRMALEHHKSAWRYLSHRYRGLRWLPVRLALRAGLSLRATLATRVRRVAAGAEPQRRG